MKKEKRDVPLRTAYSQAGRLWQPKPSSLRAQAQLSETKTETMRTETVETFELVKVKPKLLREEKGERERNCWEQWTREGTHARKTGSGATRKTTRRDDRRIVRQALVDPTGTRSTIRADVGVAIVPQTISRNLAEANLKSKRPFSPLPLTPEHRQLRLQWCQARSMWNVTDWQKVVYSDESRFVLGTDDNHRVLVWRRPGERYNSPHTVLRHTARTADVMVGGIAYDCRSTLIVMHGTLTGQRYVDDILRPHVGLS
ncbi:HTH_Tnp_Tc3_2 domain-containing protein [Trichonephila clavipes]|nr:HTH_Tnp_Tc3_2 domain-containing protein [Trichonephila clavipes]